MRVMIAAGCLIVATVACSQNKTPRSDGGTSFTLTGSVQTVQPGDKPTTTPSGATDIAGSMTIKADKPVSGCDNPTKVFFTSSTQGAGTSGVLNDKRVVVNGTQFANCVFVADSISTVVNGGGGSSGGVSGGVSGATGSPGPLPSASATPKITKGPAPEGVIMKNTPSVAPATQK